MAWQRVDSVTEVRPFLTRDAPGFELVPELDPRPDELVLDKITMSAFEGTPLDIVLRGWHERRFGGCAVTSRCESGGSVKHW